MLTTAAGGRPAPRISKVVITGPRRHETSSVYYVGITAHASAGARCLPLWSEAMSLPIRLVCVNAPPGSSRDALLSLLRSDESAVGALFTGHKAELGRDLGGYASVTNDVRRLNEVGTLRVKDGGLHASAHDVAASRHVIEDFLGHALWQHGGRQAVVLGAGGAGLAVATELARHPAVERVVITEASAERQREVRRILATEPAGARIELLAASLNNDVVAAALPGALVVNATGMGKDVPGSPLTEGTPLPARSLFWELNYRGERPFLTRVRAAAADSGGRAADGWDFFVRSWYEALRTIFDTNWGPAELAAFYDCAAQAKGEA